MRGTHHPLLVVVALFVGVVGSFASMDLFAHATAAQGRARRAWLAGAVVTTALAIWSVHFVGMLSLRLRLGARLVPIGYDIPRMLPPIVVAAAMTGAAAWLIGRFGAGLGTRLGAGLAFGAAIVGAHYAAMASIDVPARVVHSLPLVLASVAVAAVGATAAVTAATRRLATVPQRVPHRLGTALIAGAVVAATHYTAIGAARFIPEPRAMRVEAHDMVATDGVALFVAAVVLMILGFALLTAALDRRTRQQLGTVESLARLYEETRQAEEVQRFLLDVARVLATSLDVDAVLRRMTELLVPRLGDSCQVHLRASDGALAQVASAHVDPARAPLLEELGRRHRPDVANPHGLVARAIASREPVLVVAASLEQVSAVTDDAETLRLVAELAPVSWLVVPLVARGDVLGTITLATSTSGRAYGGRDRGVAELFAARAALALDNARLYTDARRAGEEAVRVERLEAQLVRTRLEALRAQLNPHFLFNALNTVAMLVRRQANADALRGILGLSELLRHALAGQEAVQTPLRAELALLDHYLAIEQLRFRDRLQVRRTIAPDTLDALVPGMILQPLVENAIRHGVARQTDAGVVEISSRRERAGDEQHDGTLLLEVCDDGPGFPPGWDPASSGGIGLANTRERLDRLYGGAARFEARNRPNGGAVVSVRLPLRTGSLVAPS